MNFPYSQNLQLPSYDSPGVSADQRFRVLPNYFRLYVCFLTMCYRVCICTAWMMWLLMLLLLLMMMMMIMLIPLWIAALYVQTYYQPEQPVRSDSFCSSYDSRKNRRRRSLMPPTSHNDIMSTVTPSGAAILVWLIGHVVSVRDHVTARCASGWFALPDLYILKN